MGWYVEPHVLILLKVSYISYHSAGKIPIDFENTTAHFLFTKNSFMMKETSTNSD